MERTKRMLEIVEDYGISNEILECVYNEAEVYQLENPSVSQEELEDIIELTLISLDGTSESQGMESFTILDVQEDLNTAFKDEKGKGEKYLREIILNLRDADSERIGGVDTYTIPSKVKSVREAFNLAVESHDSGYRKSLAIDEYSD